MAGKIYTRTGDSGATGLFGGGRVPKSHVRVEAYGAVDELNAVLGWVCAAEQTGDLAKQLADHQRTLFTLGAELATPDPAKRAAPPLGDAAVVEVEKQIDEAESSLPKLTSFILPGGGEVASRLHVARVVCRRAERRVVALEQSEPGAATTALTYLNRLSDLLFVLARLVNHEAGVEEERWAPDSG